MKILGAKSRRKIQLQIGSGTAYINGRPTTLDVAAKVVNGRTMIRLRFVTEATGATLPWVKDAKQIDIYSKVDDSLVN